MSLKPFQHKGGTRQKAARSLQGKISEQSCPFYFPVRVFFPSRCRQNKHCANKSLFLPKFNLPSSEVDGKTPIDFSEGRTGPSVSASLSCIHTQTHTHTYVNIHPYTWLFINQKHSVQHCLYFLNGFIIHPIRYILNVLQKGQIYRRQSAFMMIAYCGISSPYGSVRLG